MDSLHALRVFQEVVKSGSFTAGALRLGIERTKATRQVMQLEQELGVRLLNRTTRRISLTPAGETYLERMTLALGALDAAADEVRSLNSQPSGVIRLNAPVSLGGRYLGEPLALFLAQFPKLRVEVTLNDHLVDLTAEGIDVAIRIARVPAPSQISRRISVASIGIFAPPALIARHGMPTSPEDLRAFPLLSYAYGLKSADDFFAKPASAVGGDAVSTPAPARASESRLIANNGNLLGAAAAMGLGYVIGPYFTVTEQIARGELVPVLREYWRRPNVMAVMPSRRYQPTKVRALIDFLAARWGDRPPWEPADSLDSPLKKLS